jgi:hypothetical protein
MEMLIILGFVAFATLSVFGTINMLFQINNITDFERNQNKLWDEKMEEESKKLKVLSNENQTSSC